MANGWEGDLVRLVHLDEERHFANCVEWVNDPEVTEWLLIGDFPMTRLAEKEWFDRAMKMDDKNVTFAIETLAGQHLGSSGIHNIDFRSGTCLTGSFIGDKSQWGKGYGSDAAKVRARYCFEVLGLRTLYTAYLDGNDRSRRMSEKNGYRECGRYPDRYWKRGAYRDEVLMYLDRKTWEGLNPLPVR
jgi:RimJ/RimL family protein N-acetyltransferase